MEKWHPKYDYIEDDEEEYKKIIDNVTSELSQKESVSKDTFIRILNWKAPRVKGIVKLNKFSDYEKGIRECFLKFKENGKLAVLDELYGIGVPVASTILHFMYPNRFPIMDFRTIAVLHYAGYIKSKAKDQRRYIPFRDAILTIRKDTSFNLRQIDRALFSFHKIELEPKCKG